MDQEAGVLVTQRGSLMWCCAFKLVNGDKGVRDRVLHQKVTVGEEDTFIGKCADEMMSYLTTHAPQASGKQKQVPAAVVVVFRFGQGKRAEPLDYLRDPKISLGQLQAKDLQSLENAFAIALAAAQR